MAVNIFPKNFESKDKIEEIIKEYNESATEENKIEYVYYRENVVYMYRQ